MKPVTLTYRPHIDGLRAVAVIAVICFHAFPGVLGGGFTGVDIFFVISGFLISSILFREFGPVGAGGIGVIRDFYGRRIRRIFPSLILVLLACYAMGYLLLPPGEFTRLSHQVTASAFFYQNILLSRDAGYFDSSSSSNPLLHLWSLGIEEQFYLVWPLVVWIALRFRLGMLRTALFLGACSFLWNAQKPVGSIAGDFYLPQMRMWELLVGAVAALAEPAEKGADGSAPGICAGRWSGNFLSAAGLLMIAAALVFIRSEAGYPNMGALLPTFGTAFVVLSSGDSWVNRRILSQPVLVWIGLISYPLYLWHWPLLTYVLIGTDHPESGPAKGIAVIAATVLAWLTYRLVEQPVRRGSKGPRVALVLAGSMAAVAFLGIYSERAKGFPSRFPALLRGFEAYNNDPSDAWRKGSYFLMPEQDETKFKVDPDEVSYGKPTMFLWGDSHAAALYPGLKARYGRDYNIVQRTAAGTPPLVETGFPPGVGRQISRYVLAMIRRSRPEYVILQARWDTGEFGDLADTIGALKAAGVSHIVLVGPVPQWDVSLPQQLYNYARRHRSEPVPTRMTMGESAAPMEVDHLMAPFAERQGIEYVSPCKILGNEEGFLVRTGDDPDSLTTYDYGHLSVKGSEYVVDHFPRL